MAEGEKTLATPEGQKEYLVRLMQEQLMKSGVKDILTVSAWQEKAEKLGPKEFVEEVKAYKKEHPEIDISSLTDFMLAVESKVTSNTVLESVEVEESIRHAMLAAIKMTPGTSVITTEVKMDYEQIKHTTRHILENYVNTNGAMMAHELNLPFFISTDLQLTGQILSSLDDNLKCISLITTYRVAGSFMYQFFGEPRPFSCKNTSVFCRNNAQFYAYKFISEKGEEYVILSQTKLEITQCKISGMVCTAYDFIKIGNMAKLNTNMKLMFVTAQEPMVKILSEEDFWKIAVKYKGDAFRDQLFGKYPQPEWFSNFIGAWVCSGKLDNMPTHLSLLSPPSLGKSSILKCFRNTFNQEVVAGGTVKGLIPSFASGHPEEGYFIRCQRFGFVDEFLHILSNSSRKLKEADIDGGSHEMLKVLEHSEDTYRSAFGTIKAKPRMWAMFLSNIKPYEHIKNFVDLHDKLNAAFMSRILWYVYDDEHIAFINKHKPDVMRLPEAGKYPVYKDDFISMVDYLHSKTLDFDYGEAEKMFLEFRPYVPSSLLEDVYDSRMVMHIYRMMDGYIKHRAIVEGRGNFTATPQDIKDIHDILQRVIRSWSKGVDNRHLSPRMKVEYLNEAFRNVYNYVELNPGTLSVDLESKMGSTALQIARELCEKGCLQKVTTIGAMESFFTMEVKM